ncbi:rhomboid family intramembrane serine protease [Cutibacterium avidum]
MKRRSDLPVVTWTLIGICFLVWAGEWVSPQIRDAVVLAPIQGFHEPWRFVTLMFGHALSILHIGFNMYALWALGRSLEPFLGRARFLAAYLMSGLGGGVLFCLMASPHGDGRFLPNMNDGVVGASGAIFGLFGVLLIVQRRLGASTRDLWIVLAINAALLLFISGIAWQAHLGGFVVGLACGVIFFEDPKRIQAGKSPQTWPRMAMLLGVLVILVLLKYYVF